MAEEGKAWQKTDFNFPIQMQLTVIKFISDNKILYLP